MFDHLQTAERIFDEFFRPAPPEIEVATMRQQWLALHPHYDVANWRLPLPLWAQRPYDQNGRSAWTTLQTDLQQGDENRPFCIYLHVPFCSRKCFFCDSYSFKLGNHQAQYIQKYADQLCAELHLWSQQGNLAHRPVSTIHLGGGTPTFPGPPFLRQVATCCRQAFTITANTEWALESTVESLTPEMIATMHHLGFRRLHLGVQSLQDSVRQAIGRQRPSADVLQRISHALAQGWVVTVDLVCGLPHQTLTGWIADLHTLLQVGVNGFSLYELLIYPQNRRWAESQGLTRPERHTPNYFLFQTGADILTRHGLYPNLFNHWADNRDQNVYFTFPTRGEDCLAVGAIGDGVFGDYHYRHPRYAAYMNGGLPGLEGGLRRTMAENTAREWETAVLSGHIPAQLCHQLQPALATRWQTAGLIRPNADAGFSLTGSGAWFAGNMIHDLRQDVL